MATSDSRSPCARRRESGNLRRPLLRALTSGAPVGGLAEIVAYVGGQLSVGRVIHRLEADDPLLKGSIVLLHEPEEVQLCLGRADNQHLTLGLQRARHLAKEAVLVFGVVP